MTLAELFVRLRGDTSDLDQKINGTQRKLNDLKRSSEGAGQGLGRLNNAFANMATQIAGVNPVLGKATEMIASLGIGSTSVVTGALSGLALLAYAWDQLTKSAREATKAQDDAVKRVAGQVQGHAGGQGALDIGQLSAKLQSLNATRKLLVGDVGTAPGGIGLIKEGELEALDEEIQNVSNLLILAKQWHQESVTGSKDHAAAIHEVIGKYNELRDAAAKVNAEAMKENRDWWRSYIEKTGEAAEATKQLANEVVRLTGLDVGTLTQAAQSSVQDAVRAAGDQAQKITDNANKNAETIANAVLSGAGIVVNALNIGGGGRGSGIGGSLGSVLGTAAGTLAGRHLGATFGSLIAPGIGTIVGGLAGSLIGGLFDHKKAIDNNTAALNRMNSLLNEPTGFKAEYYRDQVSVARKVYRNLTDTARAEASRGGSVGFQLVGS